MSHMQKSRSCGDYQSPSWETMEKKDKGKHVNKSSTHANTHTHMYTHTYMNTHTHMYTHTYMNTHTQSSINTSAYQPKILLLYTKWQNNHQTQQVQTVQHDGYRFQECGQRKAPCHHYQCCLTAASSQTHLSGCLESTDTGLAQNYSRREMELKQIPKVVILQWFMYKTIDVII